MLRFFSPTDRTLPRREWLRICGASALGCLAGGTRSAEAKGRVQSPGFGRARSVILVFANGGQSQLETWDPKPQAPAEVRGEFDSIATPVPGVRLSEHMPQLAAMADRYTIVRSLTHDDVDHGSAAYLALTGRFHPRKSSNPPVRPDDFPTYGAVLKRVAPASSFPYTAVHVNGPAVVPAIVSPGQFGGFLGQEYQALTVGDVNSTAVALPGLAPQSDVPTARRERRRSLLEEVDAAFDRRPSGHRVTRASGGISAMHTLYDKAFEVLDSPACRQAFDLRQEPDSLRDAYGRYRSGQACLLARRLVEAGVPWITVMFNHTNRGQDFEADNIERYGWDTHNDIFGAMKNYLLPRFDQTLSTLLADLDDRGLLDETLVVCMGEFGRAPEVTYEGMFAGSAPGRKHWAGAYSALVAGAGVRRGATHGQSDRLAAAVKDQPVAVGDVAATMFAALGVDPSQHFQDQLSRPFAIATGSPIAGLYTGAGS